MKLAEDYVRLLQAANGTGFLEYGDVMRNAEASATAILTVDNKVAELHFADGSRFWINYINDEPIVGLYVEVGQVWETCGGSKVTITRQTIDGSFYQFEGSNGVSYSVKGFAFPDRSSVYDLYTLVSL